MSALGLTASECVHHERLERPHGPIVIGKCKKCGREKEYHTTNWYEYNTEPLNKTQIPFMQEQVWD